MHRVSRSLGELATLMLLVSCSNAERSRGAPPPEDSAPVLLVDASIGAEHRGRYQPPLLDLPAERLSERVDGAEVKLRALGCRRLRVWELREPSAELELLSFSTEQGAAKLLAEQAGTEHSTKVPGDEGWLGVNVLYFRRGSVLVRLIADAPTKPEALLTAGRRMEEALAKGEILP